MALGFAVVLLVGAAIFNSFSNRAGKNNTTQTANDSQHGSVPLIHRIQEDETLWSIATKYYQNGYHWVEIKEANNLENPDALVVGQVLTIPAVVQESGDIDSLAASTDARPLHESVIVTKGESLWTIALREYEDPYRWTDIAKANNLANPDIIHPGNILRLP